MCEYKIKHLNSLGVDSTSHTQSSKRVFLKHFNTSTKLAQFALGILPKSQETRPHSHETINEFFFVLSVWDQSFKTSRISLYRKIHLSMSHRGQHIT